MLLLLVAGISCNGQVENQEDGVVSEKASSELIVQVIMRKDQIAQPAPDRLQLMQNKGMDTNTLEIQKIFIHLKTPLDSSQIEELNGLGLTLYPGTWIPPVGAHPTGFLTADMPVDSFGALAEKDYVIKLETAERTLEPQNGLKPQ